MLEANTKREADANQCWLSNYVPMESRIWTDHPLFPVHLLLDEAPAAIAHVSGPVCDEGGRSLLPPERLVRALVLQVPSSIHGERSTTESHVAPHDPEAKVYRKAQSAPAERHYLGQVPMKHRIGPSIDVEVSVRASLTVSLRASASGAMDCSTTTPAHAGSGTAPCSR